MNRTPTRLHSEDAPVEGHVYLVLRNGSDSVKIGSSTWAPWARISDTPSCSEVGFLLACRTTATRELEHFLHSYFLATGQQLPGRDNFALTVEDILALAYWFDGGVFEKDQGGDDKELTLVDMHGAPVSSPLAFGKLVGRATRLAIKAEIHRQIEAESQEEQHRERLWKEWRKRTAKEWGISEWSLTLLSVTGEINPQFDRARAVINKGRLPPSPSRPRALNRVVD